MQVTCTFFDRPLFGRMDVSGPVCVGTACWGSGTVHVLLPAVSAIGRMQPRRSETRARVHVTSCTSHRPTSA